MKKKHLSLYYHSLSVLLEAGVPILKALRTAADSAGIKYRSSLAGLEKTVAQGNGLSESMAQLPTLFAPTDIDLVGAAEMSGNLPEVLEKLSQWYDFQARSSRKLLSGLLFPAFICIATVLIAPLIPLFLGHITISEYLFSIIETLFLIAVPFFLIVAVVKYSPDQGPLRIALDFIVLKIPLLGRSVKYLCLSRYFMAFHLMIKSGVPIIQTVQLTSRLIGNYFIRQWFDGCLEAVRSGNPVSQGFSLNVPEEYRQLWLTGEETGKLDEICLKLFEKTAELSTMWLDLFVAWLPKVIYALVSLYLIYQILRGASAVLPVMHSVGP
jgi:type IV pilus assembly protein PilC